jgi:hypothetical protein
VSAEGKGKERNKNLGESTSGLRTDCARAFRGSLADVALYGDHGACRSVYGSLPLEISWKRPLENQSDFHCRNCFFGPPDLRMGRGDILLGISINFMADHVHQKYVRLPGRGRDSSSMVVATRCSLWLGADHILFVTNQGYTESYKRFYYPDVQALIVQKTKSSYWYNVWLSIFAAILVALTAGALAKSASDPSWVILAVVAGVPALIFMSALLNSFYQGPSYSCHIRTAVQTELLPSLKRQRPIQKAIKMIRERIDAVQGQIPREEAPQYAAYLYQRAGYSAPLHGAASSASGSLS